jgi:hypothetical protein
MIADCSYQRLWKGWGIFMRLQFVTFVASVLLSLSFQNQVLAQSWVPVLPGAAADRALDCRNPQDMPLCRQLQGLPPNTRRVPAAPTIRPAVQSSPPANQTAAAPAPKPQLEAKLDAASEPDNLDKVALACLDQLIPDEVLLNKLEWEDFKADEQQSPMPDPQLSAKIITTSQRCRIAYFAARHANADDVTMQHQFGRIVWQHELKVKCKISEFADVCAAAAR